jgi:hypothetical protein
MLGSVVLVLLAALACETQLGRKRPSWRLWLQALSPLSGLLGIGAAVNGLFCIVKMLAYLAFIRYAPVVYVAFLGAGLLSLLLGLRFAHGMAMLWLGRRLSPRQRQAADWLHTQLLGREVELGYAGLAFGSFSALLNIIK